MEQKKVFLINKEQLLLVERLHGLFSRLFRVRRCRELSHAPRPGEGAGNGTLAEEVGHLCPATEAADRVRIVAAAALQRVPVAS